MATIHRESPLYDSTEDMIQQAFSIYDLRYTISGLKVIRRSEREVRVEFTLVTSKIRGPEFRDNRITGVMFLRPEDGAWKIYNQEVDNIEYLD